MGGNKKGIFTRQRQPKSVASLVRQRYYQMAQAEGNVSAAALPDDLTLYTFDAAAASTWTRSLMDNNDLLADYVN